MYSGLLGHLRPAAARAMGCCFLGFYFRLWVSIFTSGLAVAHLVSSTVAGTSVRILSWYGAYVQLSETLGVTSGKPAALSHLLTSLFDSTFTVASMIPYFIRFICPCSSSWLRGDPLFLQCLSPGGQMLYQCPWNRHKTARSSDKPSITSIQCGVWL